MAALDPAEDAAVRRLNADWAYLLDHGQAAEIAGLVTDEAVIVGVGDDIHGPDGLRAWAAKRSPERHTRHVLSNHRYDAEGDEIRGTVYLQLHIDDASQAERRSVAVGVWDDVVARTDAGLRFVRRTLTRFPG